MKTRLGVFLTLTLLVGLLAGCAGGNSGTGSANGGAEGPAANGNGTASAGAAGKTTVQFWHSLGGKNGEYMDAIIKRFNETHDDIEVVERIKADTTRPSPSCSRRWLRIRPRT
ncbi:hypothetical protein HMSSN036_38380 [Paenibacillus macerans]|nr:hypothetical protein HMSSN036_38380 [Paenibacillus macerans]